MHFCMDCVATVQANIQVIIPALTVPAYYCVNYVSNLYLKIKNETISR